ncbi:MAG: L-threonylcarbamoyladenylate synthase [Thermoguttaceae bacterium]
MERETLDANTAQAIAKAVADLRDDKVVVLPTETIYGLAARASSERGVAKVLEIKGRSSRHPLTLAIGSLEELDEFIPDLVGLGRRLARRSLPGPITLVLETPPDGAISHLPAAVRSVVEQDGFVGFRSPAHPIAHRILHELGEPIVLTSVNRTGDPPATSLHEIATIVGDDVTIVADPDVNTNALASTVVKVTGNSFVVLREGTITQQTLERLTATLVLFVCTGNTCRSPMAEVLCESLLAERLQCSPDDLENRGYVVLSAGIAAGAQQPASFHAQTVVADAGLSLAQHRSQRLTEQHVRFADFIFVLTRQHRDAILSQWPDADSRVAVLRPDGGDVADPFGGTLADYQLCADQIRAALKTRIREIV